MAKPSQAISCGGFVFCKVLVAQILVCLPYLKAKFCAINIAHNKVEQVYN